MTRLGIWFGTTNNCGVWLNGVGKHRENNEEHDENCFDKGFQLARVKFERDGRGGREALAMGYCRYLFIYLYIYLFIYLF